MEELKARLEEKNRQIEKKTQVTFQASQEKSRYVSEINELKEHMEIKDRKINVLQRKVLIKIFKVYKSINNILNFLTRKTKKYRGMHFGRRRNM